MQPTEPPSTLSLLGKNDDGRRFLTGALGGVQGHDRHTSRQAAVPGDPRAPPVRRVRRHRPPAPLHRGLLGTARGRQDPVRPTERRHRRLGAVAARPGQQQDQRPRAGAGGIDVFDVSLATSDALELDVGDHLTIGSVKHTIDTSTSGMRYKLAISLSDAELSAPYLMQQLRVLNGRLLQEGEDPGVASRVYLFIRDFPAEEFVTLVGVAVTAPDLEADLDHHVKLLPIVSGAKRTFRKVFLPGLRTVQERCT